MIVIFTCRFCQAILFNIVSVLLRDSVIPLTFPLLRSLSTQGPSLHRHCSISSVSGRRRRPLKGLPPSAAQTVRAVFPHTAFINVLSQLEEKVLAKSNLPISDPLAGVA